MTRRPSTPVRADFSLQGILTRAGFRNRLTNHCAFKHNSEDTALFLLLSLAICVNALGHLDAACKLMPKVDALDGKKI